MVEKIIVNPEEIRGLGNIVSPHSIDDYELYNSTLEEGTATIGGVETVVYDMEMVTSDISVTLTVSSASVTLGATVTLTATVLEDETPVSGEDVTFKVGTTTLGTSTTNSSGVATYSYTTDTVGTLGLTASYSNVTSTSVSLVVNKHTPTMVCTASPTTVIINNTITVGLLMTDENDDPVANTDVIFYTYKSSGTGTSVARRTDSDGVVEYTYTANNTSIVAVGYVFVGNDSYVAAESNHVNITVLPHSYSIAFSQSSYPATSGSATLEMTLTDNSVAVSGATVSVTGSDSSSYSCITNSSGVGTVTVSNVSSETTFTATYGSVSDTCTVTVGPSYLFYDDCTSSTGLSSYSMVTLRGSPSPTLTFDSSNSCYILANNASSSGGHSMMAIDSLAGENSYVMSFKTKPYNTTDHGGIGYAYKGNNGMYSIYYMYYTSGSDSGNITINQGSSDSKQTNIGSNHRNEWITHKVTVNNGKVTYSIEDADGNSLYNGSAFTPSKAIQSDTKPGICILWWDVSKCYVKDIKVEAL